MYVCTQVTRLRNGFPSTQREEDEFDRRENGLMQDLAQRMGISIQVLYNAVEMQTYMHVYLVVESMHVLSLNRLVRAHTVYELCCCWLMLTVSCRKYLMH
jgi:hypothetical protein